MSEKKVGRPTKYKPEYCEQILKFFDVPKTRTLKTITSGKNEYEKIEEKEVAEALPTLTKFALSIEVNKDTIVEWAKEYPEFSVAYKKAKDLEAEFVVENSMKGLYAQPFAIFYMKNCHGWKDKQEITGANDGPLTVQIINFANDARDSKDSKSS